MLGNHGIRWRKFYLDLLEKGWALSEIDRLSIHRIVALFGDSQAEDAGSDTDEPITFANKAEAVAFLRSRKKRG